jgi:hypothetical protein
MIIHRHSDGSEGFQYEIGDRVIVERTIAGGWFDFGPRKSEHCTVEKVGDGGWSTATHEIRFSPEWGTVSCKAWDIAPHPETIANAKVFLVYAEDSAQPCQETIL